MKTFRENPPLKIAGEKVVRKLDYKLREETNLITNLKKPIDLPSSDVLQFYTESGNKISVRPSGTEPKIKFYVSVNAKLNSKLEFETVAKQLDEKIKAIEKDLIQT
jgi:phosphoglucomutase